MTDRIRSITVILERDMREDDVEVILSAIRMIRGVAEVSAKATTTKDMITARQLRSQIEGYLHEAISQVFRDHID